MSSLSDKRVPPHNLDAEQSVLGGLMLAPEAFDEVAEYLTDDSFYKSAHKKIFACIRELNLKAQPTDLIMVNDLLLQKQELELVGGPVYLSEILDNTPSTANIVSHARVIQEKYLLRQMILLNQNLIDEAYNQDYADMSSFVDSVEARIFQLTENKTSSGFSDASQLVKLSLEKLEELYHRKSEVIGVSSGFVDLDHMTAGFQPGELTIVAARPSMGKTAFSLNIALQAALRDKKNVAYFSVEMAKEQVMIRLLSSESGIPLSRMRIGQLSDTDWPKLIHCAAKLSESSIFIDDTSGISPFEIRSKARRLKAKQGLDIIMVDYLQLMGLKQKVESREREVSEISKVLKAVAKELHVPVIALAQLNRGVEGRSDRRPMLSDLRESGSIEQDADIIMMLYREDYYDRENPDVKGVAEVIVAKQRNGPTGTVKLRWQPELGIFSNLMGPEAPMPSTMDRPHASGQSQQKPRNFAPGRGSNLNV